MTNETLCKFLCNLLSTDGDEHIKTSESQCSAKLNKCKIEAQPKYTRAERRSIFILKQRIREVFTLEGKL